MKTFVVSVIAAGIVIGSWLLFSYAASPHSNAARFVADEQKMGGEWVEFSQQLKKVSSERDELAQRWLKICKVRSQVLGQDPVTLLPGCVNDPHAGAAPQAATGLNGTVTVPKK